MKWLAPVLVVPVLLAAGCLKVEQTLSIKSDGSGFFEARYSLAEQTIAQIKSVTALEQQMARASAPVQPAAPAEADEFERLLLDPTEAKLRTVLDGYRKSGLTPEIVKVETRNGVRNVHLKILFAGLGDLAKTSFFRKHGFSLSRDPSGNYVLYRPRLSSQARVGAAPTDAQSVRLLTPLLSGFSVSVRVDTPSNILETNAHGQGSRSATWNFDFGQNPEAVPAVLSQDFRIVFDGHDLNLPSIGPDQPRSAAKPAPAKS